MESSVDAKGVKVTYITAVCWEWMGSFLKGDQEGLTMADNGGQRGGQLARLSGRYGVPGPDTSMVRRTCWHGRFHLSGFQVYTDPTAVC